MRDKKSSLSCDDGFLTFLRKNQNSSLLKDKKLSIFSMFVIVHIRPKPTTCLSSSSEVKNLEKLLTNV